MFSVSRNEEEVEKLKIAIKNEIDQKEKLDEETAQINEQILQIKLGLVAMCNMLQVDLLQINCSL